MPHLRHLREGMKYMSDWPDPLPPGVNPDDVDAEALWQAWVDEDPDAVV
jgi:hypothetical protein